MPTLCVYRVGRNDEKLENVLFLLRVFSLAKQEPSVGQIVVADTPQGIQEIQQVERVVAELPVKATPSSSWLTTMPAWAQ